MNIGEPENKGGKEGGGGRWRHGESDRSRVRKTDGRVENPARVSLLTALRILKVN